MVLSATGAGLFIHLLETGLEALLPLRELKDDYYQFDPDRLALVGAKTGRVLGIGLQCDVQIMAVDIDRGQVTLGWPQDLKIA